MWAASVRICSGLSKQKLIFDNLFAVRNFLPDLLTWSFVVSSEYAFLFHSEATRIFSIAVDLIWLHGKRESLKLKRKQTIQVHCGNRKLNHRKWASNYASIASCCFSLLKILYLLIIRIVFSSIITWKASHPPK